MTYGAVGVFCLPRRLRHRSNPERVARWARIIAVILPLLSGCDTHRTLPAVPTEAAVCIPPGTIALAGLHLEQIRATPLYAALPAAWRALLEPLHEAADLLIAYNGRDLLIIAQGHFASAPPGAVLLSPTLALAGSPAGIQAAQAQRASGRTGAPRLVTEAQSVAIQPVWIAAEGHSSLPLAGNFANLNRMLQLVDYATLGADLGSRVDIRVNGVCHIADDARTLEESLRALVTLAAASTRDVDLMAVFRSAQVTRDGSSVVLTMSAGVAAIAKLLR